MSIFRVFTCLLVISAGLSSGAADEIMVVEQQYNIVEYAKDDPKAKDVRQTLYIGRDEIAIVEGVGKDGKPTETILIDLKNKQIINLNHSDKKKITESFDRRRERIESAKKQAREDLEGHPAGANRERLAKRYRALLDDGRKFALAKEAGEPKELAGVSCRPVKIVDADQPEYVPLQAQMHPSLDLPYDNTEVLYLLRLIGKNMAAFLRVNKDQFKYVPMELHLDLAAGGKLDTQVVSVTKIERSKLAALPGGNPFEVPPYDESKHKGPPKRKPGTEEEP